MDQNINRPLVSIILPAYNVGNYIEKSIKSVLTQNYNFFELLIINDGSNDNTLEEILKFDDKRIRIINNDVNLGLQKTLNRGIGLSAGKYIARIDGDDEWISQNKLAEQIDFLENNKEYVLVGTGAICVNERGEFLFKYLKPRTDKKIKKTILGYNCFIHSSVVFRKDAIIKVGMYSTDKEAKHNEDYDLWLKLGITGKLLNFPSYSISYMIRGNSIGHDNSIEQMKNTINLAYRYKKYYPKNKFINFTRNYIRLIIHGYLKK